MQFFRALLCLPDQLAFVWREHYSWALPLSRRKKWKKPAGSDQYIIEATDADFGANEMAEAELHKVIQHLRSVLVKQDAARMTDGDLLQRYLQQRDEAAFEALVRRHGPMVLAVCRRVLRNVHDAEDAFQATFLVLVRKASSLRSPSRVDNWLYGVALRTAQEAKRASLRRRTKEAKAMPRSEAAEDIGTDLRDVLDQALQRLPEKYRVVVVLCDLEGASGKEAARRLALPEGTLASRLARGRALLAKRLARHGLALSAGSLAAMLAHDAASACVPTSLLVSTIKAATLFAAGQAATVGLISVEVAALTKGVLTAMLLTQLRFVCVVLLIGGIVCTGTSVSTHFLSARANGTEQADRITSKPPDKDESKTTRAANPTVSKTADGQPGIPSVQALQKERLVAPPDTLASADKASVASRVQRIRERLAKPVSLAEGIAANTTLREAMNLLEQLPLDSSNYNVTILIDTEAFKAAGNDSVEDTPVKLPRMIGIRLSTVLHRLLGQVNGTYLIRPDYIEVVPWEVARPESWKAKRSLAPMVNAEFTERPLAEALRELADESGISVVIDGRIGEKAKTRVTATLNSVPIDAAVLILADMADLRPVVLGNVLYVTTKENAEQLTLWHDKQSKQSQAPEKLSTPAECKPESASKPK